MATYLTIYDFTQNKAQVYPDNYACFSALFRAIDHQVGKISNLNVYLVREMSNIDFYHRFSFKMEDVLLAFESMSGILPMPTVSNIKFREIPNIGRYGFGSQERHQDKDVVVLSFKLRGMKNGQIKLLSTFCRYFYENYGSWANHVEVMEKYIQLLKNPEFDAIPRIELIQLAHRGSDVSGGHGLMNSASGYEVKITKEPNVLANLLVSPSVNGGRGIFNDSGQSNIKITEKNINVFLKNYIDENISTRPTEVCGVGV